jgi:regulator of protease activity HflC (stomatin/prohibitin superfamily)
MPLILIASGTVIVIGILYMILNVLSEYERGVIFTLGRFTGVKGPGLIIVIPVFQRMVRVDLRMRVLDVPTQDVISRDNVSVHVNAVIYYRVVDPERAIIHVENFIMATSQFAQTTLRSVLGQHELDEMLAERDKLNRDIQMILDEQTDAWGIKVANVELKHVDLEESMIRAIAKQAEAERMRRAKIIDADGEAQAAEKFLEAGRKLSAVPEAMQIRYLTTLTEIASEKASTIVFPFPMKFGEMLKGLGLGGGDGGQGNPPAIEEEDDNPSGPG